MRLASLVLVVSVVVSIHATLASHALAQAASSEVPTRVALALEGEWPESLRLALREDLAASLRAEGFELVHAADGAAGVVALVRIAAPREGDVEVRIEDDITRKHVERTLDLAGVPADALSVAIAAGAGELLRASWAELVLDDAPEPMTPPPAAVTQSLERHVEPERVGLAPARRTPAFRIAARGAVEGYLGGLVHAGGDALVRVHLVGPLSMELAFGGRGSPEASGARGRVRSWSVGGELALSVSALPEAIEVFELDAVVALRAAYVAFDASANEGSLATARHGALVVARASLRPAIRLDALWLGLELGVGVPLLGIEAVDESARVVGASELELHAGLVVGGAP